MFIKALVCKLQPQVLLRGDYLFRMNEPGDCMFFIKSGCVQLKSLDGTVVFASLMPGAFLGELSMLTGQRRTASAQAVVDCVLFLIRNTDFDAVVKDFPIYMTSILEGAMERLEKTLDSNASVENANLVQQTRRRLRSLSCNHIDTAAVQAAVQASGVSHTSCQPLGEPRPPRRLTRETIADVMRTVTRRTSKEGVQNGTDERRSCSSPKAPAIDLSSSAQSTQVDPEPTAASELTPQPPRRKRPTRDLYLEQAAVDAEGREQVAASGYSDMSYSDAARKTAGTLLDEDQILRRRRHTGEGAMLRPTKMRDLDVEDESSSETRSEILQSIQGLRAEMHELQALINEMHLRRSTTP